MRNLPAIAVCGLLVPSLAAGENRWKDRVADAVRRAERTGHAAAYREALDIAYRADAWRQGLHLAEGALDGVQRLTHLRGRIARALWRAGRLRRAQTVARAIPSDTRDRVTLAVQIRIAVATGDERLARHTADRLSELGIQTAEQAYCVAGANAWLGCMADVAPLLHRALQLADAENGYPDPLLAGALMGTPEFFAFTGTEPLNVVSQYGAAPMRVVHGYGLPRCLVSVNGHGPYRLVVDTGGSTIIGLDRASAEQIGLRSVAEAQVTGASGSTGSGQALAKRVDLGQIACERVMVRVFDLPPAMRMLGEGLLGTGVFSESRVRLDFENGSLGVSEPSETAPAGVEAPLWIVADGKLVTQLDVRGRTVLGLLDTGAANVCAISPSLAGELSDGREFTEVPTPIAIGVGEGAGAGAGLMIVPPVSVSWAGRQFDALGVVGLGALDEVVSPAVGVQVDVLIGMPVFREMRALTVDYPHRRMWVDWLESSDKQNE